LAVERDLAGVVHFPVYVKWYQRFDNFSTMAGEDRLQGLSTRMDIARRRDNTIKSTLDCTAQAIERMSLKIDDRSLPDGTFRSGHDRQSYQSPPHRPPTHHPPLRYSLQHSQFSDFFYEELQSHIYQYKDFEDDYEDEGMVYGRQMRFANLNPHRKSKFSNPNRDSVILFVTKEEDTQILMSLRSLLLMIILILSHC